MTTLNYYVVEDGRPLDMSECVYVDKSDMENKLVRDSMPPHASKRVMRSDIYVLDDATYSERHYPTEPQEDWAKCKPHHTIARIKTGQTSSSLAIVCLIKKVDTPRSSRTKTQPLTSTQLALLARDALGQENAESMILDAFHGTSLPLILLYSPFLEFLRNAARLVKGSEPPDELIQEARKVFGPSYDNMCACAYDLVKAAQEDHRDEAALSAAIRNPMRTLLPDLDTTGSRTTTLPVVPGNPTHNATVDGIGRIGGAAVFTEEHKLQGAADEILQAVVGHGKHSLQDSLNDVFLHNANFRPGIIASIRRHSIYPSLFLSINDRDHYDTLTQATLRLPNMRHTEESHCARIALWFNEINKLAKVINTHHNSPEEPPLIPADVFPGRDGGHFVNVRRLLHDNGLVLVGTWQRDQSRRDAGGDGEDVVAERDGDAEESVLVKFVPTGRYGTKAHTLAATAKLAPPLYVFRPATDHWDTRYSIAVMGYVAPTVRGPETKHVQALKNLQQFLDASGLVHGDLRVQNIMFEADGSIKVVDWDWSAHAASRPVYPLDLNRDAYRQAGIVPGGAMLQEHDRVHIQQLIALAESSIARDDKRKRESVEGGDDDKSEEPRQKASRKA
ncbi:hypothetical protein HMN09_00826100 [Mycena chlorophos]|uniref:Uncharacterized protein n=1 Tax=Mycena chlorophos TaxID=658473 RepID=A0A8H6SRT5_MYCCL|nr:hypothetical protein HMN09_00826100 [Mycena chlorophos]